MPVEIRELVIRAVVPASPAQGQQEAQVDMSAIKKELVKECVEEVLQTLKEKAER